MLAYLLVITQTRPRLQTEKAGQGNDQNKPLRERRLGLTSYMLTRLAGTVPIQKPN